MDRYLFRIGRNLPGKAVNSRKNAVDDGETTVSLVIFI